MRSLIETILSVAFINANESRIFNYLYRVLEYMCIIYLTNILHPLINRNFFLLVTEDRNQLEEMFASIKVKGK